MLNKSTKDILEKLKIEKLNPMQEEAQDIISSNSEIILLSPTGTGKTLAFLLPIIAELDTACSNVQTLIIVPSRELAIQIEQVVREMGTGFKVNAVYGGQSFNKDRINLKHAPAIIVGTPGRVADHLRRDTFITEDINTLVLDEFDKSLEIGFESDMVDIVDSLMNVRKKILTSATHNIEIPTFIRLINPKYINNISKGASELEKKIVLSVDKDKLETLVELLSHIGNEPGIIFCNFKESIQRVSDFLTEKNISHGTFFGGMEQNDRERALIKFRNGTHQLLIATDLASRGIDVPEMKFIIHYQLPSREKEFTHRNGRTARMNSNGTAYILKWEQEKSADFIRDIEIEELEDKPTPKASSWKTLFISGGRKDKISKGDIAGLFFKQGKLNKDELGVIELKTDCAFVAVPAEKIEQLIEITNNSKLKKRKVRVYVV